MTFGGGFRPTHQLVNYYTWYRSITCPSGKQRPKASRRRGVAMTVCLKSFTHTLPSPLTSCVHTNRDSGRLEQSQSVAACTNDDLNCS